jgi:hypothetical protein
VSLRFSQLRGRHQLLLGAFVVISTLVAVLWPPTAAPVLASGCPPGWNHCDPPIDVVGGCCTALLIPNRQSTKKWCTEWDHDIDLYPTCTYKVVWAKWVYGCDVTRHC